MLQPRVVMNRGYPSLFAPDSEDELSSDSGSDAEGQTRPSLLPLDVSMHTHTAASRRGVEGRKVGGREKCHLSANSLLLVNLNLYKTFSGCWGV